MSEDEKRESSKPEANEAIKKFAAERAREIKLPTAVLGFDVSTDGNTLYAACMDGGVYVVDFDSGEPEKIGQHDRYASGVLRVGQNGTLVSAGYDGVLQWHEIDSRTTVRKVKAHDFWSWQLAVSPDGSMVASTTGQYKCGGYKYEPAPEREPSVKVFDAQTGELRHAWSHVPPVESVTFSPDGRHVAAGNLMGEVRVWNVVTGKQVATWTTPGFTGWGIIKGHYYTGGVFAMGFTPDNRDLMLVGMGTTRDPAAGNGRQLWQRFDWRADPPAKRDETHEGESGQGLMEAFAIHPSNDYFVMAGRLFKGEWNVAFFDMKTGANGRSLNTKTRITKAVFSADGKRLFLAGCVGQPKKKKNDKYPPFGRILAYDLTGQWGRA